MSKKARRRPSWKAREKTHHFQIQFLSADTDKHITTVTLHGHAANYWRKYLKNVGRMRFEKDLINVLRGEAEWVVGGATETTP